MLTEKGAQRLKVKVWNSITRIFEEHGTSLSVAATTLPVFEAIDGVTLKPGQEPQLTPEQAERVRVALSLAVDDYGYPYDWEGLEQLFGDRLAELTEEEGEDEWGMWDL